MTHTHDPHIYRIVFFSGSPVGVPFLQALAKDPRFDVVGVVTMPDVESGRGQHVHENSIGAAANDLGISTILKPTRINPDKSDEGAHFTEALRALQPDFSVVVAYGKIFPQSILDIPTLGSINVHGSILPAYRGASPLQSVFLENATNTGLTIQKMSLAMDEGDIIQTYQFPLPFSRTSKDLFVKVQADGPRFLCDALRDFGKGHLTAYAQRESDATYCSKMSKEDGKVDPRTLPISTLYPRYRAYAVWPKIRCLGPEQFPRIAGKICVIESLLLDEILYNGLPNEPLIQGTALHPAVKSLTIKPEGKKAMDRESFKNGYLTS